LKQAPMRWPMMVFVAQLLTPPMWATDAPGANAVRPSGIAAKSGITVWDTGQQSAEALPSAALTGKNDWTAIHVGNTAGCFKGDAVVSNGRFIAVLRERGSAVEVHGVKPVAALRFRLRLQTAAGEPAARLERMALVEYTRGSACLEACFKTARGI